MDVQPSRSESLISRDSSMKQLSRKGSLPSYTHNCLVLPLRADDDAKHFDLPSEQVLKNYELHVTIDELSAALAEINRPLNFTPPSIIYYVFISVLAFFILAIVAWGLFLVWLLTLCDLIMFCCICYVLRKLFMAVYVMRRQKLDKAYFPGLRKTVKALNDTFKERGLEWTLEPRAQWLQLAPIDANMLAT